MSITHSGDQARRLAIFIPSLRTGGAERVVIELAHGLSRLGWRVDLVVIEKVGELLGSVSGDVTVHDLEASSYKRAIGALTRYIDDRRPDVLLGTLYMTDVVAVLAARKSRHRPIVALGAHNSLKAKLRNPDNRKDRFLLFPLTLLTFRKADMTIAVSEGVRKEITSLLRLKEAGTKTIYNPVFDPAKVDLRPPGDLHPWLRADRDFRTIISVGRLVEQKSIGDLLEAVALLPSSFRLLIYGTGSEERKLRERAAALAIDDRVCFAAHTSNPMPLYARADLFAMASRWEGFAMTIVEALAAGCPVVATDCKHGPAEILDGGRYGILTPVADPAALADGIATMAALPDGDTRRNATRLRERAAIFTTSRATAEYDALFERLIVDRRASH